MDESTRARLQQLAEIARKTRQWFVLAHFEYALEHDISNAADFDDKITNKILVDVIRRYWGTPLLDELAFPAPVGICVHLCGSKDRKDYLVVTVQNCTDGDLCVAMSKGNDYRFGYVCVPERRKKPTPLDGKMLKAIASVWAISLRHVAPDDWHPQITKQCEYYNQLMANAEAEIRRSKGAVSDA